jgi:photosystem II stability/assembly factor-like uncharacterized protein
MARSLLVLSLLFALSGAAFGQHYSWRRTLPVPCRAVAFNPLSKGQILFAGPNRDNDGVFRSDDGGITWTLHNTPTLVPALHNVHQVFCIPGDTNIVLAVTPDRLYRSTNGGIDWSIVSDTIGGVDGENIAWHEADHTVYFGQNFGVALWKSSDLGATWHKTGIANPDSIGLCALDVSRDAVPTIIQGATNSGFLAFTTDDGNHWDVTLGSDTNNETEVPKVVFSTFATSATGRHDVALAIRWLSQYRSLVATMDGGAAWSILRSPSPDPWALDIDQRTSMISKPSDSVYPLPLHFFIGLFGVKPDTIPNGMVQETTDGGATWNSTNFPKPPVSDSNEQYIWVLKYDTTSKKIAVATDSGIYIADTSAAYVQQIPPDSLSIIYGFETIRIAASHPILSLKIDDLLGRSIETASPMRNACSIGTSGLPRGVYALQVNQESQAPILRLILLP